LRSSTTSEQTSAVGPTLKSSCSWRVCSKTRACVQRY